MRFAIDPPNELEATMGQPRGRRRAPKTETDRAETIAACAAHLRDLKRAHQAPPPDVALTSRSTPLRISPEPQSSGCTSPAELCADLAPPDG
jgi:hypothetical protein